jgi:hypothetical protein
MEDPIAVGTLLLAIATFLLALFTNRMARETRNVAAGTQELAKAAQEQVRVSSDQLSAMQHQTQIADKQLIQLREERLAAAEPQVVLELETDEVFPANVEDELAGTHNYYLTVKLLLVNYGGAAVIERLHVTGKPQPTSRPNDVAGFIAAGGRMPFQLRFDKGEALNASASVPIRARGQSLTEWRESLFFVNVRFVHGGRGVSGWRAEIAQPLTT